MWSSRMSGPRPRRFWPVGASERAWGERLFYQDRVYGSVEIKEPVLLQLLGTDALLRLKKIYQLSPINFIMPRLDNTRYEHCVGVCLLLKKLGAPLEEQISGLIHDVGHTAFSHTIDFVLGRAVEQDSNDVLQKVVLEKSEIPKTLRRHGFDVENIIKKSKEAPVKSSGPLDLSADRMDYLLRDLVVYNAIDASKAAELLSHVSLRAGAAGDGGPAFVFDSAAAAKELALLFFEANRLQWANPTQVAASHLFAETLRIALARGTIDKADFLSTDAALLAKLVKSRDHEILARLRLLRPGFKVIEDERDYDFHLKTKTRFVDPAVDVNGRIRTLSSIDPDFRARAERFAAAARHGFFVRIVGWREKVKEIPPMKELAEW